MARQTSAQHGEAVDRMDPIEINGIIYFPGSTVRLNREQRSRVSKYNDDDLRPLPEFKYKALKSMRRRIRLLRLKGGGQKNPEITCELFEVEFHGKDNVLEIGDVPLPQEQGNGSAGTEDDKTYIEKKKLNRRLMLMLSSVTSKRRSIVYEALSWCWGAESKDCGIRISMGHKQRRLAVSRELILALKYLRYPNEDRILWIDALCINQADHEERNHQVQMMSQIYNNATQVCIWLGEDNDDSATAISFIREIMKLENFDSISEKKENAHKWRSLLLLMQRPWFSRRWVVQEIALARKATVYCGNDNIPWEQFAVAVELFVEVETATHRLSEVMRKDEAFGHVPQWFEHVSELGASVLVQATGKIFRHDSSQPKSNPQPSPETHNNRDHTNHIKTGLRSRDAKHRVSGTRWRKPTTRTLKTNSKLQDSQNHASVADTKSHDQSESTNTSTETRESARGDPLPLQRPLLSLEYLVSSLSVFQASQPRDVVYSLLTISRDTSPFAELRAISQGGSEEATILSTVSGFLERKPFIVDYSRPLSDVCKDFVSFCIQGAKGSDPTRALDILCRPWAPDGNKHTATGVSHKKLIPYKFQRNPPRQKLWVTSKPTGSNTKSAKQYIKKIQEEYKETWKEQSEIFERLSERFLPKKLVDPFSSQGNEAENNSNGSISGDSHEEETSDSSDSEDEPEEVGEEDMDLPSWVSPVSGAPFALFHHPGMHSMLRMGRKNADPLVGLPEDGHRNYSAAQNKRVDYTSPRRLRFRKRPVLGHYSLYTTGFILEKIRDVAEPARLGSIPETWAELAGWKGAVDGDTDPPAEFWRTLVADRGKDNRNPPYYYATACKESVKKGGLRGGSVDTSALINSERNSIVAEFCRRVQAVIWNRSLIRTESNTLGLASQRARPGDLICILFGCTVPVILRRAPRSKTEDELKDEQMQDQFESLKVAISRCEDACFRKLRYRKKLEQLEEESVEAKNDWQYDIRAEMRVINRQISDWEEKKNKAELRKIQEEKHKEKRKKDAEGRLKSQKERKRLRAKQTNDASLSPLARSSTTPAKVGSEDKSVGDEEVPTSNGETPLDENEKAKNEIERARQQAKEKARKEDPYLNYTLIGEAYVHGMMDGEAVRKHILDGLPERLFEIR